MAPEDFLNGRMPEEGTFRTTIAEILQYRAKYNPGETAYIFLPDGENKEEKITYTQFYQDALKIALGLLQVTKKGERALMLFPPGLDYIRSLFGCFLSGIIGVPAYPPRKNRSLERIRTMVLDSGASIVLSTTDIYDTFERSFKDVEELRSLKWILADRLSKSPEPYEFPLPGPGDVALLQYTSGSTGRPKGVMVTHRNIIRNVEFIRQSFGLTRESVSVTWLPSFHDMGLIDGVIEPIYTGMPGIIIPPIHFLQKPSRWLRAISKYRGTHSGGPNFAFDLCVDGVNEEERQGLDLSSLKTLYSGAEPIRRSTCERFIKSYENYGFKPNALYPCYGMAETTLITSGPPAGRGAVYLELSGDALEQNIVKSASANTPDLRHMVGVGFPWLDTVVRIVHPDTFKPCRENEVGEIWVSGSIVTTGYWNNPEETRKNFAAKITGEDGTNYLRTGDLGFFHDNELYISGRLKDLIIIHGRNYYPQDFEFLAENCHPALRSNASAAFSVEVRDEEKLVIVAEVERTAMKELDADKVCEAIRARVAEEFELEVYGIVLLRTASILKTSSGKIQRKACREAFLKKTLEVLGESYLQQMGSPVEEATVNADLVTLQAWLIAWIHSRLKISLNRIELSKPITVYGLSSMKAIQLQQDFLQKFGVNFPPYMFFEKISAKELCERALKLLKDN